MQQIHSPAQRQTVNELMLAAALKVAGAIEQLAERGFAVIRVDFSPSRPTLVIQNDARCAALIESGQAAYYSFGREDHFGFYRAGQFQASGCRVIWEEFGH